MNGRVRRQTLAGRPGAMRVAEQVERLGSVPLGPELYEEVARIPPDELATVLRAYVMRSRRPDGDR